MDEKTRKEVEAAVLEILRGSEMETLTEYKVRSAAADRLGIDLSLPDRKLLVRRLVADYLQSLVDEDEKKQEGGSGEEGEKKEPRQEVEKEEQEEEQEGEKKQEGGSGEAGGKKEPRQEVDKEEQEEEGEEEQEKKVIIGKELDDNGDLILCRLSSNRRVTLQDFKGMMLVSIREYYVKDGKEMPGSKGISMTIDQWEAFGKSVPAIEDAIKNLGESD